MPHDISMSMYDSTETHGQIKIASVKIKILHAPHNLSARKKKKRKPLLFWSILWGYHASHSRAYESCLACQLKLNFLCEFSDVFFFCFSTPMPIGTCSIIKKKNSQKRFQFRIKRWYAFFILSSFGFIAAPALPTCFPNSTPPRNFHATC